MGDEFGKANQDAKNAAFTGCVMYVLGVVDMLREWQRIHPMHAPHICVPRSVSSGELILVVQEHLEATTPWRQMQSESDAATAVIAALEAKWPCPRGVR
jgi:Rap1a immunity proteins